MESKAKELLDYCSDLYCDAYMTPGFIHPNAKHVGFEDFSDSILNLVSSQLRAATLEKSRESR